ncbi:MAG: hypothetical protein GY812_07320 [Actinomycetia bacterium]|nr:hypothetical protein [Actinomycetes bacterium]
MITRGSKFFYTAAAVGYLSALVYGFLTGASDQGGVTQVFSDGGIVDSIIGPLSFGWKGWVGEHVGYTVLMSFSAVMLVLGGFHTAFRDGDAEALAEVEGVEVADLPAPTPPMGLSIWPLTVALGIGVGIVGLALSTFLFWAGVVLVAAGALEWTVRAWSERASGDSAANAGYRTQLLAPMEIPIAAVLVIAVIAVAVSRVLLAVPKSAAVYVIIVLAAVVFGVANLLARRPDLRGRVVGVVTLVGVLVIVGAGIAGHISGEREIEEHHEGALVVLERGGNA